MDQISPEKASPSSPPTSEHHNILLDCADSFLQSAIQKPITGVSQIIDHVAGTNLTEHSQFISEPQERAAGSAGWLAEQLFSGAGSAIPFALSALATKPIGEAVSTSLLKTSMPAADIAKYATLAEATGTGFATGVLFNPTDGKDNFWRSRLVNGVADATALGSMNVLANGLGRFTGANSATAGIGLRALNTALAGAGAGAISTETQARLTTGQNASFAELGQAAFSMGVTGGIFGAAGDKLVRMNEPQSSFPRLQEFLARGDANEIHAEQPEHYLQHIIGKEHLSNFSPLERIRLIATLEKNATSPLVKPELIDSYISKMKSVASNWKDDNIEQLVKNADQSQQDFNDKIDAVQSEKSRLYNTTEDREWTTSEGTHRGKGPEFEEKMEDMDRELDPYRKTRDQHDDALRAVLDRRADELTSAVNEFLNDHGLPEVKVNSEPLLPGSAAYVGGQLSVLDDIMQGQTLDDRTIGMVFHELTHLEQDNMRIREAADSMGIGKDATAAQKQKPFEKVFPDLSGSEHLLDPAQLQSVNDFLGNVLRIRDGEKLTRADKLRAMMLNKSTGEYQAPWQSTAGELVQTRMNIENNIHNLGLQDILKHLKQNPEQMGFKSFPKELKPLMEKIEDKDFELKTLWQQPKPNTENVDELNQFIEEQNHRWERLLEERKTLLDESELKQVDDVLQAKITSLKKSAERLGDKSCSWYMNNALEREAYPAGMLAEISARAYRNQ